MKASFSCLERLFLKQYCIQHILYVSNTNLVSFVAILMLCVCSVVRKLSNEGLAKERKKPSFNNRGRRAGVKGSRSS